MSEDRTAAEAIMTALAEHYEQKRIASEKAEAAAEQAEPRDKWRARYEHNVAFGEQIGAMQALYAARKVMNEHFGVLSDRMLSDRT